MSKNGLRQNLNVPTDIFSYENYFSKIETLKELFNIETILCFLMMVLGKNFWKIYL